ncbi:hypothetical protein B566_EDAN017816 [Ephemera danica]|nr:hypothetical protein B566_EDAN017816 [Ephemera danica]
MFVRRNTAVPEDTCVIVTDGPSSPPAANLDSAGLHEDFFTFFSTVPDFVSFRNQLTGSFFFSAVTSELIMNCQELLFQNILSCITHRCSKQTIAMKDRLANETPENRGTLRMDIKLKYTKEGLIKGTMLRMQRELFKQVAEEFLLKFCRSKINTQ